MIVDDDEADCFLAQYMFKKFSDSVETVFANNGAEALILCETNLNIDAIILDINMPVMTGHEFLEAYSKKFPERQIPVFTMLTSADNETDKQKALQFPVVKDFIVKPITLDKIKKLDIVVGKLHQQTP